MRLTELTSVPEPIRALAKLKTPYSSWEHIDTVMTRAGYTELGQGNYGKVLTYVKGEKVLKLFDTDDDGFTTWCEWARTQPGNPWVPVFRSNILHVNPVINAVFMEELTEGGNQTKQFAKWCLEALYAEIDNARLGSYESDIPDEITTLLETDAKFAAVWEFLRTQNIRQIDIWGQNLMLRGGQIVFTDPLKPR